MVGADFAKRMVCGVGLAMAALVLTPGTVSGAVVADIGGDYVDPTAPPAGWAYLAADAATGGTEAVLAPNVAVGNAGNIGFGGNTPAVLGEAQSGNEFEIFTTGPNAAVEGVDLVLHPANGSGVGSFVILRYTISAADILNGTSATIDGSFRRAITFPDSISAFVFHNATQLFAVDGSTTGSDDSLSAVDGAFNITGLTVAAGDTISFVIGNNGTFNSDESAVNGTITLVPEPASMVLVSAGLVLLTTVRSRRRAA